MLANTSQGGVQLIHQIPLSSLLACDSLGSENIDGYRKILENNILKLDKDQLEALSLRIGE